MGIAARVSNNSPNCRLQFNTRVFANVCSTVFRPRMPPLGWGNIVEDGADTFPMLKGPVVKAANTKALVPFGLYLAESLPLVSEHNKHRAKVFRHLCRFTEIIESEGMFLSQPAQAELADVVKRCLLNYNALAMESASLGNMTWSFVPKFHIWAHFPTIALMINPRWLRNYLEESMIGRIVGVYNGIKHGPYHATAQSSALNKYMIGVQLAFSPFG
jgi:hypothetical protein